MITRPKSHRFAWPQKNSKPVIAVLGGTGRFGKPIVGEFLKRGLAVRVLARSPRKVVRRIPQASVISGNMMHLPDVIRIFHRAAAAFLITPVGGNNDGGIELRAARTAIVAARKTHLPHLIFLSVIQSDQPTGQPMLDVKGQIETMAISSGIPFSSLRTGCFMDIWLSFFPTFMKIGLYLVPIGHHHRFSFTSQRDVARVAALLISQNKVLNGSVDLVDSPPRSLQDVVKIYKSVSGRNLRPIGRWLLPLLNILKPILFHWLYPTGASRISLFNYFSQNDWVGNPHQLSEVFPGFQITSMKDHISGSQ